MTKHRNTRIAPGHYSYRGFEIIHEPELQGWNIFTFTLQPEYDSTTWEVTGEVKAKEWAQISHTLTEAKEWIDEVMTTTPQYFNQEFHK